ncbi:MAG TPA: LamG-like jellyroll fold domain-containing protein [Opitutaceae bacterium]|nr:LamG-like jellyroll fold domain-containing protein [Opitutaceae bacterium]
MLRRIALLACCLGLLVESFGQALVHLTFDDPQDLAKDGSGHGNHGAVQGAPAASASGRSGGAIALDGSGGVQLGGAVANALGGSFTVSLWVRTTQTGIPENPSAAVGVIHVVAEDDSTTLPVALSGGHAGAALGEADLQSQSAINHGDWVNVVLTRDAQTGAHSLFVNGQLEAHRQGSLTPQAVHELLVLGLNPSGQGLQFAGEIDDFQLYDRAIPASDVAFLHANPGSALFLSVPEPATVALFGAGLLVTFSLAWRQRRRSATAARPQAARTPPRHGCRQSTLPSRVRSESAAPPTSLPH